MEKKIKALRILGFILLGIGASLDLFFYIVLDLDFCCYWFSLYDEIIGMAIGFVFFVIGGALFYVAYKMSRKKTRTPPTDLPEGWQCRKCGANNPNTRADCIYCGHPKD